MATSNWQQWAACADADIDLFFVKRGGSTRAARAYCARCPVVDDCLELALTQDRALDRYGIFGGLSPRQRMVAAWLQDLDPDLDTIDLRQLAAELTSSSHTMSAVAQAVGHT